MLKVLETTLERQAAYANSRRWDKKLTVILSHYHAHYNDPKGPTGSKDSSVLEIAATDEMEREKKREERRLKRRLQKKGKKKGRLASPMANALVKDHSMVTRMALQTHAHISHHHTAESDSREPVDLAGGAVELHHVQDQLKEVSQSASTPFHRPEPPTRTTNPTTFSHPTPL